MPVYHDEIEIEDFEYDEEDDTYYYPCPCGDSFQVTKEELESGIEIATCPSCSLVIKIIYDIENFKKETEKATESSKSNSRAVETI
uniref:Diphthamide biosynthesis protein 3 n=1 Tax=Xenopsylla cheopis TaxID=163159 RepID=A0A6M2DU21_XENCH